MAIGLVSIPCLADDESTLGRSPQSQTAEVRKPLKLRYADGTAHTVHHEYLARKTRDS